MNSTPLCLVLWLCLLGSLPSQASSPRSPSLADAPAVSRFSLLHDTPVTPVLPGTQAPESLADEAPRPAAGWRVLTEVGVGLAGGLVGGLVGLGIGSLEPVCDRIGCGLGKFLLGYLGLNLGLPVGVWLGGGLLRGDGLFLATLLGAGVGVLGFFVVSTIPGAPNSPLFVPALVGLPLGLAVVGYEVSHLLRQPSRPRRTPGVSVQPLLAPVTGGALVGLGGRF